MARYAIITSQSKPTFRPMKIIYASTFLEKLQGLMFRKMLREEEGLLLVETSESRINSSIHMFFMNYDIGVVWLDASLRVVDTIYAKRWHPFYAPTHPAQFTLELHPNILSLFSIGDQIALSIE